VTGTQLKQRLAAILAADVAGYSRLMAADERATVAALDAARKVFRSQIESNQGRVIDMAGDSVLAVFETATGAVTSALAVQQELNASSSAVPEDRRMRFRIGVHLGDVIEKADGTVYGDGVNIAARLEGLAEPGGITVSASIRIAVKGKVSAGFEDQGEQTVKNIPDPVRAYRINLAGATASKSNESGPVLGAQLPSVQTSDRFLSVVVLPFANRTGDSQQEYLADGITESLTMDLSRIRDAFIVNVSTAYTYKDKPVIAQQVGKDLGVRFVMQGSVQRSGSKIRINAQLADTTSNAQLWSETFEGDQSDLFALQDQVTARIGNSIGREIVIIAAREAETRKSSPKVADLMLRARALSVKPQSLKNHREIEALYREVLALEPNHAGAMASLALTLTLQAGNFGYEMDPDTKEKKYVEGRDFAAKAKEFDPNNPRIYAAIAVFAAAHDDYAGLRRAAETMVSIDPRNPSAYLMLANALLEGGEAQRAIEVLTQAISLDPKHPNDVIFFNMSWAYFMLGDNDAAIEWALKASEMNPALPDPYALLAMAYTLKEDDAKARAAVADLRRVNPTFSFLKMFTLQPSSPAAYKEFFDKKFIPAWHKAGLPE
jgi:adenylate cyclase